MSQSGHLTRLEPDDAKVSRPVLRGGGGGNTASLPGDDADRLTAVTRAGVPTPYSWSDRGELLSDGVQNYEWNAAGRLIHITGPEELSVYYTYNGANNRVEMTVNSVTTAYVVDPFNPVDSVPQVLRETTGGQSTRNLYGLDLVAQQQGATTTYLGYDALSVRLHLDDDGAIAATYRYGPYGEVVGAGPEGYGYTGEQWDHYTNLLYLRARYYNPAVGGFMSRDEWSGAPDAPASLHRLNYARNNPVNHADPTGQWILLEEEGTLNAGTIWAQSYGVFGVRYDEKGNLVILHGGYRFINWQEVAIANFINTCDTKWLIGGGSGSANAWVGWSVQESAGQLGYYYRAKGIHPIYLSMVIMGAAGANRPSVTWGQVHFSQDRPPYADYNANLATAQDAAAANAWAERKASLSTAGQEPDSGDLTRAGRAFQKHGNRNPAVWGQPRGNAATLNTAGQTLLNEIINARDTSWTIRHHALYGDILEGKLPDGRGARWSADGSHFYGFLDP